MARNQTYEFTDVDRTATAGLSLKGARWRRPQDTVGLAAVVNGISAVHRQYLAAGGLGITVGDGALDYRAERIAETYYNWKIAKHFHVDAGLSIRPKSGLQPRPRAGRDLRTAVPHRVLIVRSERAAYLKQ